MAVGEDTNGQGPALTWSLLSAADKASKREFEVLHHHWRVRILEVLTERDISVSQMVDEGLIPDLVGVERSKAISKLAYHFRELRAAGAIEVVEENPRYGSTEHVCRGAARAHITTEEWAKLPIEQRRAISRTMAQGLMARTEGALLHDSFDSRVDRHIAWAPMNLDEQGWSAMADLLDGTLDAALRISAEAEARLKRSGEQPIRTTWGQVHFEAPPLPPPPE